MAGFILYRRNFTGGIGRAKEAFARKGLALSQTLNIGNWKLATARKLLCGDESVRKSTDGTTVAVFGSPLLPGLSYSETRRRILEASCYQMAEILRRLRGHFLILANDASGVTLYQDCLGIQRVYALESGDFFSSSFLATASACPRKLCLDKLALAERISTGELLGTKTLFEQVIRCEPGCTPTPLDPGGQLTLRRQDHSTSEVGVHAIDHSVDRNAQLLTLRLQEARQAASEHSALLGISSGYDSRLLLAASRNAGVTMSLFTHHTAGVHYVEHGITDRIGDFMDKKPARLRSRRLDQLSPEEVESVADDCLHFFDGCTSRQRGALQETFTQQYYRHVFAGHSMFFNGIGGEIFRNHTGTRHGTVNLDRWMERHLFFPFGPDLLYDDEQYDQVRKGIRATIANRLDIDVKTRLSLLDLRRFYAEVQVPDSDANILNAHNQLLHVNAPFTDSEVIAGGLAATPNIGLGGSYEAALIQRLAPELGNIAFNDGYHQKQRNLIYRLRNQVRAHVPPTITLGRIQKKLLARRTQAMMEFDALKKASPIFESIEKVLLEILPSERFHLGLLHYAQRPATLYLGLVLLHFHDRIRW